MFREGYNPSNQETPENQHEQEQPIVDFILEKSREIEPSMVRNYTAIHENPELGGEEYETAARIKQQLEDLGIEILGESIGLKGSQGHYEFSGTNLVARIAGKEDGPTIALRADMDALPIQETESNLPRSKKENVMHACGHDAHVAGLLGAAEILKELADRKELDGNILLLFQSNEEHINQKEGGAVQIIKFLEEKGLRKDIDAFFAQHVFTLLERGQLEFKEGTQLASVGEVNITLKGPGGHIFNVYDKPSLNRILSNATAKLDDVFKEMYNQKIALVASPMPIYKGGKGNILPSEAESTFSVRITSPEYKEKFSEILQTIKNTIEETVQEEPDYKTVEVGIKVSAGTRPLVHRSSDLINLVDQSANEALTNYKHIEKGEMAGDDFAFYLEELRERQIPGLHVSIGAANSKEGYPKVGHHRGDFKIDPGVLKDMAALHATFAVNAINYFKKNK
jgi:amidohydrolase